MINVHRETERSQVLANVLGGNAGQWAVLAAGTGEYPTPNHVEIKWTFIYLWDRLCAITHCRRQTVSAVLWCHQEKTNRKTNRKELLLSIGPPGCQLEMFSTRICLSGWGWQLMLEIQLQEERKFFHFTNKDKVIIFTMGTPRYYNKTSAQETWDKIRPWDAQIMRALEKKEPHRPVRLIQTNTRNKQQEVRRVQTLSVNCGSLYSCHKHWRLHSR